MANGLARFIDLREGERVTVVKAFIALFSVIAAHTLLETARDALFLGKLPPSRLPIVYVVLAGLAFVLTTLSVRFVQRFGRRNALVSTLLAASYGTTLLHFLPQTPVVVFSLYLWSGLLGTVLATQFWIFASQLFTVAQGKRLFGPIAAGGVAGAVAGAGGAAAALEFLPVSSLLLAAGALFLGTALLLTTLRINERRPVAPVRAASPVTEATTARSGIELFREYPYLRWIALALALSTAAALTTDYLFKSVAAYRIPAAELGSFFARTYAVLNASAFVVQIGLTGLLIRRLGVIAALAILPLGLLAGGVGTLVIGGTVALALLTKGADGALRHSLHRVGTELAWMPLPADARDGSKELLETVFGRGVQAAMAGLLFLLSSFRLASPRVIASILVVLSAGWIAVVIASRRPYIDLFRQALSKGSLESSGNADELDLRSVESVLEALSSREAARVIAAMDLLEDLRRSRLIPGLILYHESEEVLLRALEIIAQGERRDWIDLAERLFSHPSEAVRLGAVRALASVKAASALERALLDPCQAVRSHAAFSFAHSDGTRDPRLDPRIARIMEMPGDAGRSAKLALLDAIHDRPDPRWTDVVLSLSEGDDPAVMERSTLAMTRLKDGRFIPILIPRLSMRDGRGVVRDALVHQGPKALDALALALADPETDPRVRLHLPRTISRFGSQRAADVLTEELGSSHQGVVRYKALRGLVRLASEHDVSIDRALIEVQLHKNLIEHLRLLSLLLPLEEGQRETPDLASGSGWLVTGLLEDKRQQALERAFWLLQLVHKSEDIRSVYLALRSVGGSDRAHAMEFLDALTFSAEGPEAPRGKTRALFQLVTDDLPDAERLARGSAYVLDQPAGYEASLRMLLWERDTSLAAIAAYHALEIGSPTLHEEVAVARHERPALGHAAPLDKVPPSVRAVEVAHDG